MDTDSLLTSSDTNAQLFDCIDALTFALVPDEAAEECLSTRLQRFTEALGILAEAADANALPGLIDVSAVLADRICAAAEDEARQERMCDLLARFPLLLMDYVVTPTDASATEALIAFLQADDWQTAMADEDVEMLRMLLCSPPDFADDPEMSADAEALDSELQSDLVQSLVGARESETDSVEVEPSLREAAPTPSTTVSDSTPDQTDGADVSAANPVSIDVVFDADSPQQVSADILALAVDALEQNFAGLGEALALTADASPEQRRLGWEQLSDELDRMAGGAEVVGLTVLGKLLLGAHALVGTWQDRADEAATAMAVALATLPDVLRGHLCAPTRRPQAESLVAFLRDLDVDSQLDLDWSALAGALTHLEFCEPETGEAEERVVLATAEDVSLTPPDDINQELLEGLLTELPIQTGAFTEAVQRIASGHGRISDIDNAKRAAHTLKGAANTVGIKGIANLTHYLEDILIALADHSALPHLGLSQTLAYAADCLEVMSEALVGAGDAPDDAVNVLQDVLNWANRIDAQGIEVAVAERPSAADADSGPNDADAPHARHDQAVAPVLRVPSTLVDEQLRLVGESMTSTAQIQNRLEFAMQQLRSVNAQNELLRQLVNELEDLVDLRGLAMPQPVIEDTGFDLLELDQYGELHTVTRRLVEVTTDASEMTHGAQDHLNQLNDLVGLQSRLHLASQDAVLRARMVAVSSVVSRLQRAVRQAGRLLDKEVDLVIKGAETFVDGNVLNDLVDALMHVLRNAVDHGIEMPQERQAAGKDPVGHIEMSFKREGDLIIVSCRDDGQGLDIDNIRRVALRRNLIGTSDLLSDDQVARLILAAGFSTRDEATQVSGRGIGLDAVHAMVEELKGSIALHSEPGRGLTVEIRLPTTLLSAQALLVRLRGTVLAVTTRGIDEIHFLTQDQLQRVGAQLAYRHGDQLYDALRLGDLLNVGDGKTSPKPEQALLLVRMSSGASKAVLVEEIAESRSLVVKKLGPYVGRIGGVIGATILGDGSVAPVIDLPDLLRVGQPVEAAGDPRGSRLGLGVEREDMGAAGVPGVRTALVVDDSISARRTTAQLFRDAGFEVRTAIDGLDAVAALDRLVPDIIMTDLEMPRMNGLELTSHIRARAETKEVPIVMITSRSTEKHRHQAQVKGVDIYLTKPFNSDDLMRQIGALVGR
ncbi:hybrid sensor histidine kinase/response regulator [Thiorhodococcus fuscus]|uniref:histidine kinase n=1 Tax=Thiorhodococcus fuscus TaxID=527200 RepID=A0ABW4YC33_9GAMM